MSAAVDGSGMRVALLNPCFWPEVRRGSERFARDLCDGLLARGHTPRLVTSHPGLPRRSVEDGLEITRHWRPPESRLRRRGYWPYISHLPFSYLSLARGDDDVAHALYPSDALAAARWSRRSGRPAVFSVMGIVDRPWLAGRRRGLELFARATTGCTVVVLSAAAAAGLERCLGVRARVIAPGVDLDAFAPDGERTAEPTIFCAAALDEPRKRGDLLMAAFAILRARIPDARLVLSRPRDPRRAEGLLRGLAGVELVDVDERAALARQYSTSWVSVLPAQREAFGLVLAEALACGTPVVGAGDGALPELVDRPEIGRLFAPGDADSLAEALLDALALAQSPATRAACRARAADFSLERCVDAYERLYRELLA